jgi:hypothetical protein
VEDGLVAALATAAVALGDGPDRHQHVVSSVASYLDGGAPVADGRSIYGGIAPQRIRHLLGEATGVDMSVEFVHDGTASACGVGDPSPSAVVTMGTWLGVGFTPSNRRLLPGDPAVREGSASVGMPQQPPSR